MADEPDEAAAVGGGRAPELLLASLLSPAPSPSALAALAVGAWSSTAAPTLLDAPADDFGAARELQDQQQQQQDYQDYQDHFQRRQQELQLGQQEESTWSALLSALFYKLGQFDVNWPNLILALVLAMLMLTTAIGNLFVIVAILIERNLRTIGNYLVLSLAIADLLVACLVMPLAGIYQILGSWTLGTLLCDIWTSADVFCCTASILHLLAIALDRYWAVTRVDYIRCQRNERRILFMILFVWMAACVISMGPVFGWKDDKFEWRITKEHVCQISQDIGYQIFATCTTFYFPLTLTLIFYWKIYQVARKRIRRKPGNRVKISLQHPSSSSSTSSPYLKQQQQQSSQSGQPPAALEGQSGRSVGWRGRKLRLRERWPSGWLRSKQQRPPLARLSESSNADAALQQQAAGAGQTLIGLQQASGASTLAAPGRPSDCLCPCHPPQQQATPARCCLAQPPLGPAATTTDRAGSRATAVDPIGAARSPPIAERAAPGGVGPDPVGVAAGSERRAARAAPASSGELAASLSDLRGGGRQRQSPNDDDERAKLKLQGEAGAGDGDHHGIGSERRRSSSAWPKSTADNQIFGARLSRSDTAGAPERESAPKRARSRSVQSCTAPAPTQAPGAPPTGRGPDHNMGAGQSNATIQTKDSQQRNLAGPAGSGRQAAEWPAEPSQLQSLGARDLGSGFDNDRPPSQLDLATPAAGAQTTATVNNDDRHDDNTRPVYRDDRDGYDDGNDTNSNANAAPAPAKDGLAPREEPGESVAGAPGASAVAGGRSSGCSKCRRCHWARQARQRSATQIGGASEQGWRQAAGTRAGSFSSEIQSSAASCSRTSSLANCALDFGGDVCGQAAAASHSELPLGCLARPGPPGPPATLASSANGCELSTSQFQQLPRHQRAQQHQQRYSSGATGSGGSGGAELTEASLLDECCACCCNSQSHSGTAIAEADDNGDDDDDGIDMVDMELDADMDADRLARAKSRRSSATSCSNSSSKLASQQRQSLHRHRQQQRLADSRVSLDERGSPFSELAAPPAAAAGGSHSRQSGQPQQHQSPEAALISLACEPQASTQALGPNSGQLGAERAREHGQQQQPRPNNNNRRPSLVACLLALLQAAPVALCWRSLRVQLNRRSKDPFVPPAESSAACEAGLLQAAARNANNMNTILVDQNGQSLLVRGAAGGNGAAATTATCKICHCAEGAGGGGLVVQQHASSATGSGDLSQQPAQPAPPPLPPPASTSITLGGAGGSHELAGARTAGMVIAASTANIAVTTARPPFASSNSVQYQASTLAAAAATEGLESKRERKAAKTLAIITGVFVMCWLPFFVMALSMPLLNATPHKYLNALLVWLGYANSMLNPIIYTIFSPDFRRAFKRLLCGLDTEAERRRRGATKHAHRPTRPSHNTTTNNISYNNTDAQQSSCYNSCSTTTAIGASSFAFVRRIHPLLARCCLPSVERATVAGSTGTRTTTTTNLTSNSNKKNIDSEISERRKTERATTSDKEAGGLLANSNYLHNQGQLIGFQNKQLQQEPSSTRLVSSGRSGGSQAISGSQGTIITTGRPMSSVTNNF